MSAFTMVTVSRDAVSCAAGFIAAIHTGQHPESLVDCGICAVLAHFGDVLSDKGPMPAEVTF